MNWRQKKLAAARQYAASQFGITRCICGWWYRGSFGVGRDLFEAHRRECTRERAAA